MTNTISSNKTRRPDNEIDEFTDDLHELCVRAVAEMVMEGITKHISYIMTDDFPLLDIPDGMVGKVTVEFVPVEEAKE